MFFPRMGMNVVSDKNLGFLNLLKGSNIKACRFLYDSEAVKENETIWASETILADEK